MAYFYTNLHTKTKGIRFLLLSLVSILNLFQAHSQSRLAFMHGDDGNSGAGTGLSAWVSNGDGTFKQCKLFDTGFNRDNSGSEVFGEDGAQQTFFVDVTGDGLVDIVHVTEYGGNAIYVYRGLGTGAFSKTAIASTGMTATTSGTFAGVSGSEQGFVADVTGDGKLDYVQSGDDNKIHVFVGNGNGTFQASHTTTTLTGNNGSNSSGISTTEAAFLIDVNGDGKADLVETNEGDNRSIRVWLATTAGSFATTPLSTTNFQQTASSVFTGRGGNETVDMKDVNGDGKVDFVAANEYDSNIDFFVYLGNGDGTFVTTYIRSVVTNPTGTYFQVVGDYDAEQGQLIDLTGDNKVDFVFTADNLGANSGIYVYKGNGDGTFQATPVVTLLPCTTFQTGHNGSETSAFVQLLAAGTTIARNCRVSTTATAAISPGGVNADLLIWMRADSLATQYTEGSSVDQWSDAYSWGGTGQVTASQRPTFNKTTKLLNYNPSLSFDGGDELKTDQRLYCNTSQYQLFSVGYDERTNLGELRATLGVGSDGNYPAMDLQKDGVSPNGWNPWTSGSSPAEWNGGSALLFNGNTGGTNKQSQIFSLGSTNASTSATNNIISWVDGYKEATTLDSYQQAQIGNGLFVGSSVENNGWGVFQRF